jgi:hypothetical protein
MSPAYTGHLLALTFTPPDPGAVAVSVPPQSVNRPAAGPWIVRYGAVVHPGLGIIVIPTWDFCRKSDPQEICDALNRIYAPAEP